jgi:orotate phosphoribosyltransferase
VVGEACLIDRSGGDADVGVPLVALARYRVPAYRADQIPPEMAAIPPVKPGSRGLA